jgi:small subunit ribosomal protein S28e
MALHLTAKFCSPEMDTETPEYYGRVIQIYGKSGGTGELTHVKLELLHNNRTVQRALKGTVFHGDIVTLLECEREHRRSR